MQFLKTCLQEDRLGDNLSNFGKIISEIMQQRETHIAMQTSSHQHTVRLTKV